jgi:hypothetical protein
MTSIYQSSTLHRHHQLQGRRCHDDESLPMIDVTRSSMETNPSSAVNPLTSAGNCSLCCGYESTTARPGNHRSTSSGGRQQLDPTYAPAMGAASTKRYCCHQTSRRRCSCSSTTANGTSQGLSTGNGYDVASSTAADVTGNLDGWSAGPGDKRAMPLSAGGGVRDGLTTVTSAGPIRTQWDISILNGCGASGAAADNIAR